MNAVEATSDRPQTPAAKLWNIRTFIIPNSVLLAFSFINLKSCSIAIGSAFMEMKWFDLLGSLCMGFLVISPFCYSLGTMRAKRHGDFVLAKKYSRNARCGPIMVLVFIVLFPIIMVLPH